MFKVAFTLFSVSLSSTQARVDDIFKAMQQVEGPSSRLGKGFRVNEFFYCFLYKWLFMNLSKL